MSETPEAVVAWLIEHKDFQPEVDLGSADYQAITPADEAAGYSAKPLVPLAAYQSAIQERDAALALADRLKLEAQIHAGEARGANATIYEIYQVLSGGKGEPGNWHGAEPARQYVAAAEASNASLRQQLDGVRHALANSMTAIDDWLNLYASDHCDEARVAEARERVMQYGTIGYIAQVQEANRIALKEPTND